MKLHPQMTLLSLGGIMVPVVGFMGIPELLHLPLIKLLIISSHQKFCAHLPLYGQSIYQD
jgi:hypothetical protein